MRGSIPNEEDVRVSPGERHGVDLKSVTLNFPLYRGTKFHSPLPAARLCILWQVSTGIDPRIVLLPRTTLFRLRVSSGNSYTLSVSLGLYNFFSSRLDSLISYFALRKLKRDETFYGCEKGIILVCRVRRIKKIIFRQWMKLKTCLSDSAVGILLQNLIFMNRNYVLYSG